MKKMLLLVLLLCPFCLLAQIVDSAAFRQGDSLLQVSRALTDKREFGKAFEVNAALEKLTLEKFGRESGQYGSYCFDRGRIYQNKGNYLESEKYYLEANAIYAKMRGKDSPDYAAGLNQLAILYRRMGAYKKSELLYVEAIAIYTKVYGKESPKYASGLHNLANLYADMDNYEEAEPLYLEAKAIREKKLGKEHSLYASSLTSLAIMYQYMGNYEKAEPLYLESKAIREKAYGKEHPSYALGLISLASLYKNMGNYEKAEMLHLEAKAIRENTIGKDHPDQASNRSLANLYYSLGQYEKAEPLYLEIVTITEKYLGKEHPEYAASLLNLAVLYHDLGNYEKAELLYLKSKIIIEKSLGKEHSTYALSLYNFAMFYQDIGNYEKAESLYQEQAYVAQSILEKAARHLSERELSNYMHQFSKSQNNILSFVHLSASKKATTTCYDNTLFYKGFLLQTLGQIKRLSIADLTAAENFNRLKTYERSLAEQYALPIADRDSATVADLETKANDLEKELARTVAGFGQAIQRVKWQQVKSALKPNEAAIEFVSYHFYHKKLTDRTMYTALVVLPGSNEPQFIPLFEEKQLAALFQTERMPEADFYNDLYAAGKTGSQLYDLIWKPIADAIPAGTTVYTSPSGLLHRLNLGAIPTPDGKTMAEKHRLNVLGSTRQLVVPSALASSQNMTAQLYGGIHYDGTPVVVATSNTKTDDLTNRRGSDFAQTDSTLRGDNWNYLRWTEVEITAAAEIMHNKGIAPILKKGAEATEESFKAIGTNGASPRILHVATHGFFFPDLGPLPASPSRGGEQAVEKVFKVSDNPMIRSGLVLAGGNHAWKTGKPLRPDLEDGILTAYEISQMNLANTELVVLSACETGLGDLVGNEGVYGLQRAFKIAGARYLIMSLWQVPDFQTQVFMTTFYKHWLDNKMDIPEAFRATQAELQAKYKGEAFKWAGFVLVE